MHDQEGYIQAIHKMENIELRHKDRFSATIEGIKVEGRVSLTDVGEDGPYLCQNEKNGWSPDDTLGFEYGWSFRDGFSSAGVRNFKILDKIPFKTVATQYKQQVISKKQKRVIPTV